MIVLTTVAISEEAYRIFLQKSQLLGLETPEALMERILENFAEGENA